MKFVFKILLFLSFYWACYFYKVSLVDIHNGRTAVFSFLLADGINEQMKHIGSRFFMQFLYLKKNS